MRIASLVLAAAALAGCSAAPPPPPQKTVIDTQLKALEKAKAVEQTLQENARDADKELKDAGG